MLWHVDMGADGKPFGMSATAYRSVPRQPFTRPLLACWLDRPSGQLIRRPRRYEHARPGDLLHIDVKKLGRMPPGGGWRAH